MFSPDGRGSLPVVRLGPFRSVRAAVSGTWRPVADLDRRRQYPIWSRAQPESFPEPGQPANGDLYTAEGDTFKVTSRGLVRAPIDAETERPLQFAPGWRALSRSPSRPTRSAAKEDKLVFIFNFFDELRRRVPLGK